LGRINGNSHTRPERLKIAAYCLGANRFYHGGKLVAQR
jgi:hypothetical protein